MVSNKLVPNPFPSFFAQYIIEWAIEKWKKQQKQKRVEKLDTTKGLCESKKQIT